MTTRQRWRSRLWLALGAGASFAILGGMIWAHLGELSAVGAQVHWRWVVAAVLCALGSYAMVGLALEEVLAIMGHRLSFAEVQGVALVSTTANYFFSTAGITGFALKAHLLRKRGVPYGATVTASVVSSAILYMVLAVIVGQGLIYLLLRLRGTRIAVLEGALGLLVLLAVAVPLMAAFFSREIRGRVARKVFHWINRAAFLLSKAQIPREDFDEFERQLDEGLERVRTGPVRLIATILFTAADWGLSMATLYLAFLAVGIALPVGHLSAGFTVGMAATLIPLLPGGLGAVEGSMAAVYEALGIDWDRALVAVLLYRFAYYLVPGAISIVALWGLKISEPSLLEDTVRDTMPDELKRRAAELERKRRKT